MCEAGLLVDHQILIISANQLVIAFPFLLVVKYNRIGASFIAQLVKNPPSIRETPVRFLGWEDPLEKGKATHSSTYNRIYHSNHFKGMVQRH